MGATQQVLAAYPGFVGRLDPFTANLTMAWDLRRRLLSSYTGPAFLARADRTGQPTADIPYKSDGTWDTSFLASFAAGSDVYVVTPYNQCSSGLQMTQTFAANQPKIVSAGVVSTNGAICASSFEKWTVSLSDITDLVDDNMGQFCFNLIPSNDPANNVFLIAGPSGLATYLPYVALGNVYFDWTSPDRIQAATPAGYLNMNSFASLEKDASQSRIRINGSVVASGPATGTLASGALNFSTPTGLGFTGNYSSFVCWKTCDSVTAAARYAAFAS